MSAAPLMVIERDVRPRHADVATTLPEIVQVGELLAKSGFFADARDAAQAVTKILAGRELGIPAFQAMTGIYLVKGRLTLSANLMASLVKRSGRYDYRVRTWTAEACEVEFFEGSESVGTSRFDMADAKRAGLGGDNWAKYPKAMLFARAMSAGVKAFCPDVTGGPAYTPDELGAVIDGETGEIIQTPAGPVHRQTGEILPAQRAESPAQPAEPVDAEREGLIRHYGALRARAKALGSNLAKLTPEMDAEELRGMIEVAEAKVAGLEQQAATAEETPEAPSVDPFSEEAQAAE